MPTVYAMSIHKQPGKPNWFCSFATWDAEGEKWRRHFKSTGTAEKRQALEICRAWTNAARAGKNGKLTPDSAREIIARGVADVFAAATLDTMPTRSVRDWCAAWLESKRLEAEPSTLSRYAGIVERFTDYLGTKANKDVASLTATEIGKFRDVMARDLSRNSANLAIKVLRVALGSALKQGLVTSNPASKVDVLKQRGENKRRGFTVKEIERVLKAADGSEWRGMVLAGLYTGARLSDLARLTWRNVDLEAGTLNFTAKKTGGRLSVPLAKPLADYLENISTSDDPSASLFPMLSKKTTSKLSEGFRFVLADAGLATPPKHRGTGKGLSAAREVSELSFHSLRHSFVSILKATGSNEATAMALAGHATQAVSQNYTSLDDATLRAAVNRLPDVTRAGR